MARYPNTLKQAIVEEFTRAGIPDAIDEGIATTLVESGGRLDAVGDSGNSGGAFQENSAGRGAGIPMSDRFNPRSSARRAAKEFKAFVDKGYNPKGFNPELAYAAQRPADKGSYIQKLNAALGKARSILGGAAADVGGVQTNEDHLSPVSKAASGGMYSIPEPDVQRPRDLMGSTLNDAVTNRREQTGSDRLRSVVGGLIDQKIENRRTELANQRAQDAHADATAAQQAAPQPQQQTAPQQAQGEVGFTPGGGWGGTEGIIKSLVGPSVQSQGLSVTSAKRDNKNPASGNRSDHHIGNKNAFAWDISNGSNPTPEMDAAASDIVRRLGGPADWGKTGGNFTKQVGNHRFQVIYRSQVGGNHDNHVHVGVHRV